MHHDSRTPLLARLMPAILGLFLSASVSVASAQSLPDIQRMMKQGQLPQALEKVDAYIATKPKDPQGRFTKGLILTDMGRQADAVAVFTKLTEDFPELPEPYNNLAVLYAQQKQYEKARAALEMAIRTNPSYSIAHDNLGDIYAKLASQAYDKALQLDSSNTSTQSKLSMIKEIISTSSKPGTKPAAAAKAEPEPTKVAAAEPAKPTPAAPAKPIEKAPEPAPAAAAVAKPAAVEKAPEPATPIAAPAAKAPAEKAPAPAPAAAAASESEVTKALQGWASAWSAKDVKAYLAYYASDFQTPNGMARKAWETERSQRIDKPGKLQVTVDDVKVSVAGDKATVRFRQHYNSSTLKTSTNKTVVFVKSGGKWLIQQERVG
jgi:tetratricopeptide (TPR) repeat protein